MFTSIILSAIIALSAIFAQAPSAQVADAPAPAVECMEDMPCFDPETMGNSHEADPMEADAYASYDALGVAPVETVNQMVLTYVGSYYNEAPATQLAANQFAVQSVEYPEVYHVLQWDTLYNA